MKRTALRRKARRPRPGKDFPEHLEFVRGRPCLVRWCDSNFPVQAHHRKTGYGTAKAPDSETVPLCLEHHAELHDVFGSEVSFEKHYDVNFEAASEFLWAESPHNPRRRRA